MKLMMLYIQQRPGVREMGVGHYSRYDTWLRSECNRLRAAGRVARIMQNETGFVSLWVDRLVGDKIEFDREYNPESPEWVY